MTAANRYLPHYTTEDYARWQGDWELWEGIPISMAPGPFGRHQKLGRRLMRLLEDSIEAASCEAEVVYELDWIVSHDTVVRPDVLVVCGVVPDGHLENPPALIIEVLSDSTREHDRSYKRDLYESQGVNVYVMADPTIESLEFLVRDKAGKYHLLSNSDASRLKLCEDCEITLDTRSLF